MKGKAKVIQILNDLLAGELTAIDQYFIHSRIYEDMGLNKLFERLDHERLEETDHADQMIKRILFLEGKPDLSKREPLNVGDTVSQMLKNDLDLEYSVINNLKAAIAVCETEQDFETRAMLLIQLEDSEEDHVHHASVISEDGVEEPY